MLDLVEIANSRIAEPLSKGENIKKLLALHISPYIEESEKAKILEDLKDIDLSAGTFLEWFGVLKGISRPKTTIDSESLTQFFNVFTPDNFGFSDTDISKPLFFSQDNYFKVGDLAFKIIIKAYCQLTNFQGTVDEFSYFFKEIFGVDIQIRHSENILSLIIENTNQLTIDTVLLFDLTPSLPQTKNIFYKSPYKLFSLEFDNIEGTNLDFDEIQTSSLYFLF